MTRPSVIAACVLISGAFGLALVAYEGRTAAPEPSRGLHQAPPSDAERAVRPVSTPSPAVDPASRSVSTPGPDDGTFSLARLRGLWVTEPEAALAEAEVLEHEVTSPEERGEVRWIRTRSLVTLGRFSEARALALAMKREAPDSPFTVDVERHLLVHPLGLSARDEARAR